jgi:hypothetical protein
VQAKAYQTQLDTILDLCYSSVRYVAIQALLKARGSHDIDVFEEKASEMDRFDKFMIDRFGPNAVEKPHQAEPYVKAKGNSLGR